MSSQIQEIDESVLLSAVLSGGVIGGVVGLADRGFDRAKYAIPIGMLLGIFLDYQLKKKRSYEHVEVSKSFFDNLWENVSNIKQLSPEINQYWQTITDSLGTIAGLVLSTYGFKAIIGLFTNAGIVHEQLQPDFIDLTGDPGVFHDLTGVAPPLDDLPPAIPNLAGGNPISTILAPATMQMIVAFGNQGGMVRHAGAQIATTVVTQAIMQSGLQEALINLVGQGANAVQAAVPGIVQQLSDALVNGLTLRQENMYLTNENLLLLQDPAGENAYAILNNLGNNEVGHYPAVRLPYDEWRNLHNDLAGRLNLTPLQDAAYPDLPAQGPVQDLNPWEGPKLKLSDLYDEMADEAVSEIMNSGDSVVIGEAQLHPSIDIMQDGGDRVFGTTSFGVDDLDLTTIRDEYTQAAATMQDSFSTMGGDPFTQSSQWDYLAQIPALESYWESLGYMQGNPNMLTDDVDPEQVQSLMNSILIQSGIPGVLTMNELFDIILQVLRDPKFQALSAEKRLRKFPNYLVKVLGWEKTDPNALPLARAIMQSIGIFINQSAQAAVDFMLGNDPDNVSDPGDI
jgi:hypothetical protein